MTIEERAKEYAFKYDEKYQVAMFKAYIEGATEQKQIDEMHSLLLEDAHQQEKIMLIDKVCDLMIEAVNNGMIETADIGKLNMWLREKLK